MGYFGKIVTGAGVGLLAVAAAPFTGGGSLLAGASIATSLAGAGAVAAGVGAASVGAMVGAVSASIDEDDEIARTKRAKEESFKDGMNEGKALTVEEIKKFTDFYLATTALSYFVARCDGNISIEEEQEIAMDLDAITKNLDISDSVKKEINMLKKNVNLTFEDVTIYLDRVSVATLKKLQSDVNEIIEADNVITKEEAEVKEQFASYLKSRS